MALGARAGSSSRKGVEKGEWEERKGQRVSWRVCTLPTRPYATASVASHKRHIAVGAVGWPLLNGYAPLLPAPFRLCLPGWDGLIPFVRDDAQTPGVSTLFVCRVDMRDWT